MPSTTVLGHFKNGVRGISRVDLGIGGWMGGLVGGVGPRPISTPDVAISTIAKKESTYRAIKHTKSCVRFLEDQEKVETISDK